jgi:hypothetical protein
MAKACAFLGETFKQFLVGVRESRGRGGEDLDNSGELSARHVFTIVAVEDGNDEDGADTQVAGNSGIDAWVEFGIDGKLGLTGLQTGAGKTVASVDGDAEVGGDVSGSGAADHLVSADKGERGSGGMSGFGGAGYELVQNQI